jgi:hypothetical protein
MIRIYWRWRGRRERRLQLLWEIINPENGNKCRSVVVDWSLIVCRPWEGCWP